MKIQTTLALIIATTLGSAGLAGQIMTATRSINGKPRPKPISTKPNMNNT